MNINKTLVSDKVFFGKKGFKYFIGPKDAKKNRPLCIFSPKMRTYKKNIIKRNIYLFW